MDASTPLMKQYLDIKSTYGDAVLLFQMGDFFECFLDDAVKVSEALGLVLTKREKKEDAPPMAGFPIKALDDYLPKLVAKGYKVAIARQIESPQAGKGIVKRAVTEVITQGTVTTQEDLLSKDKNYLLSIFIKGDKFGIAISDITTGELKIYEHSFTSHDSLQLLIERIKPREILKSTNEEFTPAGNHVIQPLPQSLFEYSHAQKILLDHFKVPNLDPIGLSECNESVVAAGVILDYIKDTKKNGP